MTNERPLPSGWLWTGAALLVGATLTVLRHENTPESGPLLLPGFIFGTIINLFSLAMAGIFGFSAILLCSVVLQWVGVLRGMPFSYNYRNLIVRWKTTLMTALAFTLVVSLMTVMLAFVNGMFALTKGSGQPGQRHGHVRRLDR